jgi:hypothetical protein
MVFFAAPEEALFLEALRGFVGVDLPVADVNDAVGVLGDIGLVRDEDDGVAFGLQLIEQRHDLNTGFGVEISGGLVGQDDRRAVDQRARNGDALTLTAGELVRLVVHARFEADVGERLLGAFNALGGWSAVIDERQLDIVERACARQQVEGLEDESDFLVPDSREFIVIQFADELTVEPVLAFRRRVEAANEVHQSRFAGARGTHDRDVFILLDAEVDAAQGMDLLLRSHVVRAPQILHDDHVATGSGRVLGFHLGYDAVQSHLNLSFF